MFMAKKLQKSLCHQKKKLDAKGHDIPFQPHKQHAINAGLSSAFTVTNLELLIRKTKYQKTLLPNSKEKRQSYNSSVVLSSKSQQVQIYLPIFMPEEISVVMRLQKQYILVLVIFNVAVIVVRLIVYPLVKINTPCVSYAIKIRITNLFSAEKLIYILYDYTIFF